MPVYLITNKHLLACCGCRFFVFVCSSSKRNHVVRLYVTQKLTKSKNQYTNRRKEFCGIWARWHSDSMKNRCTLPMKQKAKCDLVSHETVSSNDFGVCSVQVAFFFFSRALLMLPSRYFALFFHALFARWVRDHVRFCIYLYSDDHNLCCVFFYFDFCAFDVAHLIHRSSCPIRSLDAHEKYTNRNKPCRRYDKPIQMPNITVKKIPSHSTDPNNILHVN